MKRNGAAAAGSSQRSEENKAAAGIVATIITVKDKRAVVHSGCSRMEEGLMVELGVIGDEFVDGDASARLIEERRHPKHVKREGAS